MMRAVLLALFLAGEVLGQTVSVGPTGNFATLSAGSTGQFQVSNTGAVSAPTYNGQNLTLNSEGVPQAPYSTFSLAAGATQVLGGNTMVGQFTIATSSNITCVMFVRGANLTTAIGTSSDGSWCGTSAGQYSFNIYWDGTAHYVLQNNKSSAYTFWVSFAGHPE